MNLTVENLTKNYGRKEVLCDVSFVLENGVYGLLGPNGAGKSTLMQLITMNLQPTWGKIYWNGKDISEAGAELRSVLGYMPQQQTLYPSFTAEEFLLYMAALHGMKKEDKEAAVWKALEAVNLTDAAGKKIKTFSGGMKQRLLLAQAVLSDPQLLILDEPTAGLDPYQRIAIRNLIAKMAMDRIILIATHVVQDIEVISKEILLMKDGKLIRKGTSYELCRELDGRIFEVALPADAVEGALEEWTVYGMRELEGHQLGVRILADKIPEGFQGWQTAPSLEDVYLYQLGGTWNAGSHLG